MGWRAFVGIHRVHRNAVLLHVIPVEMVQVTILKIVGVAFMIHSRMATVWAMLVGVSAGMLLVSLRHNLVLSEMRRRCDRAAGRPHALCDSNFSSPIY
jgi:hypothetical protein